MHKVTLKNMMLVYSLSFSQVQSKEQRRAKSAIEESNRKLTTVPIILSVKGSWEPSDISWVLICNRHKLSLDSAFTGKKSSILCYMLPAVQVNKCTCPPGMLHVSNQGVTFILSLCKLL